MNICRVICVCMYVCHIVANLQDSPQRSWVLDFTPWYSPLPHRTKMVCVSTRIQQKWWYVTSENEWPVIDQVFCHGISLSLIYLLQGKSASRTWVTQGACGKPFGQQETELPNNYMSELGSRSSPSYAFKWLQPQLIVDGNLMRNSKLRPSSKVAPEILTRRKCEIINDVVLSCCLGHLLHSNNN